MVTPRISLQILENSTAQAVSIINSNSQLIDAASLLLGVINNGNLGLGIAPTHRFDALEGITGTWFTNTGNAASSLKGWHINKTDKTSATSHGVSYDVEGTVVAEQGVDFSTNVASKFGDFIPYFDPSLLQNEIQIVTVGTNTAGQFKLTFSAQQTADIAFNASAATVQSALEALSNIAPGDVIVTGNNGGPWRVEFAATYAATNVAEMTLANGTTPLSGGSGQGVTTSIGGSTGGDILRFSPYVLGTGVQSTKAQLGFPAGSPAAQAEAWQIVAKKGLSGLTISIEDDAGTVNGMNFVNRSVTKKRVIFNFQNCWQMGVDYANANAEHFSLVDSNRAGGALTRLFVAGDGGLTNLAGVNTNNPLASWHIGGSSDSSFYDVIQTHLAAGYSTLNNRMIQLQAILDASQTTNFLWLMGTLGASSTRATPTASSVGPTCHGIESTNTVLSLISAPSGTNQTINRVLQIGNNTLGWFDTAPTAKATITGSRGGVAALASLLTELAAKGLITDSSTA